MRFLPDNLGHLGCEAVSLVELSLLFWMIIVPSSSRVLDWFKLQDEGTVVLQNAGTHQLHNTMLAPTNSTTYC